MPKSTPLAVLAAALLLAAGTVGNLCARAQVGRLSADLEVAQRARAELGEELAATQNALRDAHSAARGAGEEEIARAEQDRSALEAERSRLEAELTRLRREQRAAHGARQRLEREVGRLERELAAASARPAATVVAAARPAPAATAPAVDSAPAARDPSIDSTACPPLERPDFSLEAGALAASRLGGRLELRAGPGPSGPTLAVGGASARPVTLGAPPQRFAFDCEGTSYVVSVCEARAEPLRVAGRIAPAEDWRGSCAAAATTP